MNIGPTELLIILFVLSLFVVLPVWAIVDALRATELQWQVVGQNRYVWVALIAAGTFFGGFFGFVLAIVYLVSVRPKLARAAPSNTGP